ncbi:MAG: hypothetical protein L6Q29_00560 [Candidatus Pacebacteria bacterium]|nr:hypothetical protein [Candidatus Paceibacterota bacterium]NUQ57038.1 hypothetical protein [Candidatus Paceibacter sp.]
MSTVVVAKRKRGTKRTQEIISVAAIYCTHTGLFCATHAGCVWLKRSKSPTDLCFTQEKNMEATQINEYETMLR